MSCWRFDVECAPKDGSCFVAIIRYKEKLRFRFDEHYFCFARYNKVNEADVLHSIEGFLIKGDFVAFLPISELNLPDFNYEEL